MGKGKEDDRETRGTAILKQALMKRDTDLDIWREWFGTGVSAASGIMLAAYSQKERRRLG